MKIKEFKNGYVSLDHNETNGFYTVKLYKGTELEDKVSCDDRHDAMDYYKSFAKIAKRY